MDEEELVTVYTSGRMDAEVVRSMLEGNGIEAMIDNPGAVAAYPVNVGAMGEARVLVKASDEARARELIGNTEPEVAEPGRLHPWVVPLAIAILVLLVALFLAGELQWF
ncbi:MAG TPA: DUF2007 domain-containing protein [Actinomycetota bacterium]|nr:DUF2007 domain-containing protein [Actinomycetota bacterium]